MTSLANPTGPQLKRFAELALRRFGVVDKHASSIVYVDDTIEIEGKFTTLVFELGRIIELQVAHRLGSGHCAELVLLSRGDTIEHYHAESGPAMIGALLKLIPLELLADVASDSA
jgi:hypothetical protein